MTRDSWRVAVFHCLAARKPLEHLAQYKGALSGGEHSMEEEKLMNHSEKMKGEKLTDWWLAA
jgi:hypothetical protein